MSSETSNGVATPVTPKMSGLALTEYTAAPTPPSEREQRTPGLPPNWGIPEAFLLPNGYPDVSSSLAITTGSLNSNIAPRFQYLRLILTSRVYDVIEETPLTHAVNLSSRLESRVLLKREDLLPVFSFKLRGAYNKMAHLNHEQRWKGVIACSAGEYIYLADKTNSECFLLTQYRKPCSRCGFFCPQAENPRYHRYALRYPRH
jgi:threonine dehydratase